jgi:uncharacterized protein
VRREPSHTRPRDRYGRPLPREAADEMPARVEPEDVATTVQEALERGITLFDEQRFFEAHEFFEFIWKHDAVDAADRDFWKGVTQVAVGCVHTQRGNATGALTLLQRAADHLGPYPSPHHGVDTATLREQALAVAERVRATGASPDVGFPSFPRYPAAR